MKSQKIITLKATFLLLFFFCLGLLPNILYAQYTAIPDPIFEQALIDLGIDSDGTINGQVLTSDIDTVITLHIPIKGIDDLTGIEDFTALESLDVSSNDLTILDVSNNVQLKELYCSSSSEGFNMFITSLDLSNNINLELLYSENLILLESLNLKNGNNSILNVTLPCELEGEPCELPLDCVTVDNAEAATNDEPPYSDWYIDANYTYSKDCSLGIPSQKVKVFSVYPNPVKDKLILSSLNNDVENLRIYIYTIEGKLLHTQNLIFNKQATINVSNFSKGVYFISLQNENGQREVVKFVKE